MGLPVPGRRGGEVTVMVTVWVRVAEGEVKAMVMAMVIIRDDNDGVGRR